jgi:5S rRNA maturation endonuclease (ribonuclease M5)
MEEPNAKERTLRIMRDEDAAGQFIAERIETYERMWEGCGCKIDYYR